MKNDTVVISFKLPKSIELELAKYAHDHYITKSDFVRNAVIEKLQDIDDNNFINEVLAKGNKSYTHEEVLRELDL